MKYAEGPDLSGRRIVLIEDVVSSGGAIVDAAKMLRSDGIVVGLVICVIDRQIRIDANIFQGKIARISCVGGGPGSDIIAVLKYLDEYEPDGHVEKIICYLLDKEQAWADTWTELDESFDIGIPLNANFQPLDVTNPDSWQFQQKFLQADLFTMSYFVSEVHSLDKGGEVSQFWSTLFQGAKPGALFVYDDNGHDDFNNYFDAQWKAANLHCVIAEDNIRWTPHYSEQATELGDYLKKF